MLQSETVRKYDTYKDSGIEWIGKIPHEWNVLPHKYIMSKVKNICEKYDGEDIISLTMKGVIKRDLDNPMGKMPLTFDGYQRIETGNLLLCLFDIDVTPRCVGLIKDDGLTSPAYSQFKFLGQDCPQYYTYLLTMIDDDKCFLHLAKNLRSSLTEDNFGAILTIQPPLEEQQKIADYLDKKCGEIDKVVETEKSVIEKLKEYKQSIITEAVTKGLDKSTPLKDSGIEWIGKIPQHWNAIKFKYCFSIIGGNGFSETLQGNSNGEIPFCKCSDINDSSTNFVSSANNYVSVECCNDNNFNLVPENSILIAKIGEALKKNHRKINTVPCCIDNNMEAFVLKNNVDKLYYFYVLKCIDMLWFDNGGTIPSVNNEKLKNFKLPYINKIEQQQIADYLDNKCSEIDKAITGKEQLIEKLTEYKKSLIYECVTGKRKVATRHCEECQ